MTIFLCLIGVVSVILTVSFFLWKAHAKYDREPAMPLTLDGSGAYLDEATGLALIKTENGGIHIIKEALDEGKCLVTGDGYQAIIRNQFLGIIATHGADNYLLDEITFERTTAGYRDFSMDGRIIYGCCANGTTEVATIWEPTIWLWLKAFHDRFFGERVRISGGLLAAEMHRDMWEREREAARARRQRDRIKIDRLEPAVQELIDQKKYTEAKTLCSLAGFELSISPQEKEIVFSISAKTEWQPRSGCFCYY